MSPLFDQLEDQLREAAHERVAARRRWRLPHWLTAGGRVLPVTLAVATTMAVVVVALVVLHGSGSPGVAGQKLPTTAVGRARWEAQTIARITKPLQSTALCRDRPAQTVRPLSGRPSLALRRQLAVLSDPPAAADRLSPAALREVGYPYFAGDVRLAQSSGGTRYYLVPIRFDPASSQPSPQCIDAQLKAVLNALPSLPASVRAGTLNAAQEEAAGARRAINGPVTDEVCLIIRGRGGDSSECGQTTAASLKSPTDPIFQGLGRHSAFVAIVPNGVATLVVSEDGHTFRGHAHGNVVVIAVRGSLNGGDENVIWLNQAGQTIQATASVKLHGVSCQRQPAACAALQGATGTVGSPHISGG